MHQLMSVIPSCYYYIALYPVKGFYKFLRFDLNELIPAAMPIYIQGEYIQQVAVLLSSIYSSNNHMNLARTLSFFKGRRSQIKIVEL